MQYVRAVGSPYLGVYPDLGNLTNAALQYKQDLYADIRTGQGHLFAMHLKETRPGIFRDLDFGDGHVDFSKGFAAARAQGVGMFVTEMWDDGRVNWYDRLLGTMTFVKKLFG